MSYVVAMCREGVLSAKSKRLFAIWPLTYVLEPIENADVVSAAHKSCNRLLTFKSNIP